MSGSPDGGPPAEAVWRRVPWEGEVDMAVAPAMLARALDGANDDRVVVDMKAVRFMDAAGLGALIKARRLLRGAGGDLLVRNPPAMVRWMLAFFELADLIEPGGGVELARPLRATSVREGRAVVELPRDVSPVGDDWGEKGRRTTESCRARRPSRSKSGLVAKEIGSQVLPPGVL